MFDAQKHRMENLRHAAEVYTAQHRFERCLTSTRIGTRKYCKQLMREAVTQYMAARSLETGKAWIFAGMATRQDMPQRCDLRHYFVEWARKARLTQIG